MKHESDYNIIDWWKKVVIHNYANFNGRARRKEYWFFTLANVLIIIPAYVVGIAGEFTDNTLLSTIGFALYGLVLLGTLIPTLAVSARRLHDTNKSGWNYLFCLLPFIGSIMLLIWFFSDGDRRTNNYGDDPKNPSVPEFDFDLANETA